MSAAILFVGSQAVLSLGASVSYFWRGDWKHGLYWLCSTVITLTVTVLSGKQ